MAYAPFPLWRKCRASSYNTAAPGPVYQPACRESGAVWRKEVMRLGGIRAFIAEEDGVAVVEVVLILLVLIALVLLFKDQITRVLKSILSKAASQSDSV